VSKGTGVTLFRCQGEPHATFCHLLDVAISIGGTGFIIVGTHLRFREVIVPTPSNRMLPGIPEEWYCLERISDGSRRDILASQVDTSNGVDTLNAMEVLARVEEDRGVQEPRQRGSSA
jgi:hypothetical protein